MKEHYICYWLDGNDKPVDFERFTYRRIADVKQAMQKLWNSPLYHKCLYPTVNGKYAIYSTPTLNIQKYVSTETVERGTYE